MVRDGQQLLVDNGDVVVGDLLQLDTGDKIVADGITTEFHGLVVDEASLTGESEPVKKGEDDVFCRSGTQAQSLCHPPLYLPTHLTGPLRQLHIPSDLANSIQRSLKCKHQGGRLALAPQPRAWTPELDVPEELCSNHAGCLCIDLTARKRHPPGTRQQIVLQEQLITD